jgi:hypothetical protein
LRRSSRAQPRARRRGLAMLRNRRQA